MSGIAAWTQRNWVLACCIGFALLTAIAPFARAFYRVEVNYDEGWNVYNAAMEASHQQLYPARTAWTTINYPMLSYVVMAQLHRWTHEYLFTARALSLVSLCCSCLLVAGIVRRLGCAWRPALMAGFFCLAMFSVAADFPAYVGMDDPQMLAQAFYLAALWLYLGGRQGRLRLALVALLFVIALSIKHNPIEFPLAVLADLLLIAPRRALWYCAWGIGLLAISLGLQYHYGGPYFFDALLAPRHYEVEKAFEETGIVLGPLVLPFGVAFYAGYRLRSDPRLRIAAILLLFTVIFGWFFIGGDGVSINALFGSYFAISILIGLFLEREAREPHRRAAYAPLVLYAWLLIPWLVVPPLDERAAASVNWNPPLALKRTEDAQRRFDAEVALLRSRPGPALCESLLRCYFAGKPYIYDPFNATRMIGLGRLDAAPVVDALRKQQYGAVQLSGPIDSGRRTVMFAPQILAAIRENYQPVLANSDGAIYLPNAAMAENINRAAAAAAEKIAGNAPATHPIPPAQSAWPTHVVERAAMKTSR